MTGAARPEPITFPSGRRRAGCTDNCIPVMALVPGVNGRREVRLHDPEAHEAYGARGHPDTVTVGPLTVDFGARRAYVAGAEVNLTRLEWRLLAALARVPHRVTPARDILVEVWGPAYANDVPLVRMTVMRLRSQLGAAGALIDTVTGRGYTLTDRPSQERPVRRLPVRWARMWDACRRCGRTRYRHRARGYCNAVACRMAAVLEAGT